MKRWILGLLACTSVGCSDDGRAEASPFPGFEASGHGTTDSPEGTTAAASDGGVDPGMTSGSEPEPEPETDGTGDALDGSTTSDAAETGSERGDASTGNDPSGEEPVSACCAASGSGGCDDAPIEACVCAQDDYCCSGQWDIACVTEVEDFGCGSCGMADEIATCEAFCETLVTCDPQLGFPDVATCVNSECLGLLDRASSRSEACLDAMSRYYACVGLLSCGGYDDYVGMNPPDGFPCMGFQDTMFETCPFIGG